MLGSARQRAFFITCGHGAGQVSGIDWSFRCEGGRSSAEFGRGWCSAGGGVHQERAGKAGKVEKVEEKNATNTETKNGRASLDDEKRAGRMSERGAAGPTW